MAPARSNTAKVSWCISTRARSSWPSVTRVSAMRGGSRAPAGRGGTPALVHQPFVDPDIISRHPTYGEASLELFAATCAVEREHGRQRCHRLVDRVHHRPGDAGLEDLLDRTPAEGEHGGPAGHGLDHHQAEGLGPIDGKQERTRVAEELGLLSVVDLAEVLDPRGGEQRLDLSLEVLPVGGVHLCADVERKAGSLCDLHRTVEPLLRRDATDEGEIAPGARPRLVERGR